MLVLVTGSSGVLGSAVVALLDELGCAVVGLDNNQRAHTLGPAGDSTLHRQRLMARCRHFTHLTLDVRDAGAVSTLLRQDAFDVIVHCAAVPGGDGIAAEPTCEPAELFSHNTQATLHLLEACARHRPRATFVHASSMAVYGGSLSRVAVREFEQCYDVSDQTHTEGWDESLGTDAPGRSIATTAQLASDTLVREYARTGSLRAAVVRLGPLEAPHRIDCPRSGWISTLVRRVLASGAGAGEHTQLTLPWRGKRTRDALTAKDAAAAIWTLAQAPRSGELYNVGGGRLHAASELQALAAIAQRAGVSRPPVHLLDGPGSDASPACLFANTAKFREHYPSWKPTASLRTMVDEAIAAVRRSAAA